MTSEVRSLWQASGRPRPRILTPDKRCLCNAVCGLRSAVCGLRQGCGLRSAVCGRGAVQTETSAGFPWGIHPPAPDPPQAGPPEESRKSNSTMGPCSPGPAHLSFPPSSRKPATFLSGTGPQLVWPVPELLFSGWGGHVVQGRQSQCPWHWAPGIGPSRANQRPSLGVSIRPPLERPLLAVGLSPGTAVALNHVPPFPFPARWGEPVFWRQQGPKARTSESPRGLGV